MAENLRVNSKTTIAEFKRKHNWLVENSTIKLNVSNIKSLSNEDIENLNCGDIVLKEDASGKHAYLVSFKNDTGMCLTYVDASCVETQSYDKVGNNWVYNSEDKTPDLLDIVTKTDIQNGTLENAKPIYCHPITISDSSANSGYRCRLISLIFNNTATPFTATSFMQFIKNRPNIRIMVTGSVYDYSVEKEFIASYYYYGTGNEKIDIDARSVTGNIDSFNANPIKLDDILAQPTHSFSDGVNKIN